MKEGIGKPIFVVGSPRSGTSILTWCIGQHPNILPQEESNWLGPFAVDAAVGYQRGSERGLAIQRFFEPESAPDLVPDRWPDHRMHRRADDALEAAGRFQRVHFRLADRLLGTIGADRGRHDCRLLSGAPRRFER